MKIHLAQPNHRFGNNAFLPYSVACLWAFARQDKLIRDTFQLARPMQFDREPFSNIISSKPDVLALSCYVWNWEYNLALAEAVKNDNPECKVILGGPQVPKNKGIHNIDAQIIGEGELAFVNYLKKLTIGSADAIYYYALDRTRDLNQFPSPYLEGNFDRLIRNNPTVDFHALWETHRGCPYSCTFCDWGSAVQAKVMQFDMERLKAEMIWFSDNQIELIYNCDANFGMLPRDEELIAWLIACKENTGFPQKLRAAYPKIHTERIIQQNIALNDSGLGKGVTLSLQSLDADVLTDIKRKNIAIGDFAGLSKRYAKADVPTYTELILGLPGETFGTFCDGINRIFDVDPDANLAIYPCIVLPNSEMADPAYRAEHGLKTTRMQQMLLHGTPTDYDIPEYYDVVTETNTMTNLEWRRAMLLAHMVQAFHCTGLTRELAKASRIVRTWTEFYIEWAKVADLSSYSGLILKEYANLLHTVENGGSWDQVLPDYGTISWPAEEASYIKAMEVPTLFVSEVCRMMSQPSTMIGHQMAKVNQMWPDKKAWAQQVVWYGRKAKYDPDASERDIASDVW